MFQEYELVRLKKDKSTRNLYAGTLGTVLMIFDEPNLPRAYEVEFFSQDMTTLAILTVQEEEIERAPSTSN